MVTMLLSVLFAMAGLLALTVIAASALHYGPAVRALREELAACTTSREMRFVVTTTHVRREPANTRRAGFRPLVTGLVLPFPQPRPIWRAAA